MFEAQMALAASLRRPVSMHCVKAHGFLFDYLRTKPAEDLPPAVAMHSFTGSVDMAKAFLRYGQEDPLHSRVTHVAVLSRYLGDLQAGQSMV